MLRLSCYKRIWDQWTEMNELKKLFASSKATNGMLCYCVKRGGMTKQKCWRHITNTYSWVQEKYDNKHGVGILLNKRWKQRIIDTEYINERAISVTIVVKRQRIKLMSVYFTHSGYADHHIEKCTRWSRSTQKTAKRYIPIIGGDYNAELGLGHGNECISVCRYTLNEGNKRGDWMKHWLMLQGYTALNMMYKKTPQKQTTFVPPKGKEKQIDYILTKWRYLRHTKDAEANDMIHMGSDHRCVMATFTITMPGKNIHYKNTMRKNDMIEYEERDQAKQTSKSRSLSSNKDTRISLKK